jgi:hypothetical protein
MAKATLPTIVTESGVGLIDYIVQVTPDLIDASQSLYDEFMGAVSDSDGQIEINALSRLSDRDFVRSGDTGFADAPAFIQKYRELKASGADIGIWDKLVYEVNAAFNDTDDRFEESLSELQESSNTERFPLRFGNQFWNEAGPISLKQVAELSANSDIGPFQRDYDRMTSAMMGDFPAPRRYFIELETDFNDGDSSISLAPGLTVVIATSGKGKTVFVRHLLGAIASIDLTEEQLQQVLYPHEGVVSEYRGVGISWNEREYYSANGPLNKFVSMVNNAVIDQEAQLLVMDSMREMALGGESPGAKGINTQFFAQLTQWHHVFADRGVSAFLTVNPIQSDPQVIDAIVEALRGSVNGIMVLDKPGHATYEHASYRRQARAIKLQNAHYRFKGVAEMSLAADGVPTEPNRFSDVMEVPTGIEVSDVSEKIQSFLQNDNL